MRFKKWQQSRQVPELNLTPLLDVLMSVLTFFIIIAMNITGQNLHGVHIPEIEGEGVGITRVRAKEKKERLLVFYNKKGQIIIDKKTVNKSELARTMKSYLQKHPKGMVKLNADGELSYTKVKELLKYMGKVGGKRVVLGVKSKRKVVN